MTTFQIISLVGFYITYSLLVMSIFLKKDNEGFTEKIKVMTVVHNTTLYRKYTEKKISAMVYKTEKREFAKELRTAKRVNMFVSPFMAPSITLTLLICLIRGF